MSSQPPALKTAHKPRRSGVFLTLLAVISAAALAPLLVEAWILIDINREALETLLSEYQQQVGKAMAQRMDATADQALAQVRSIGQGFALAARAVGEPAMMRDLRQANGLDGALDSRLLELRYFPVGGEPPLRSRPALPGGDPRLEKVFAELRHEALQGGEPVSDPFFLPSLDEPMFAVGAPVRIGGRLAGGLVGLLSLAEAWDALVREAVSGHTIYAVNRSGELFAHGRIEVLRQSATFERTEIVERFLTSGGTLGETLPFRTGTQESGRRILGTYMPTRRHWGMFVQAEERLAYYTVDQMIRSTLFWAVLALSLALLVSFFFARRISGPIRALAEHAHALAGGDFSGRVELRSRNEIGELAETFNFMSGEIERYIEQLKKAAQENNLLFLGTIRALAAAIDEKDPYTRGHSERVNKYSVAMARRMGVSKKEVRDIHVSSLLHDVGKIGVDDRILRKPGALTPEEFEEMKKHPEKGANIMSAIKQMRDVIPGIHFHHEKYGGGGYPKGIQGENIPVMARLIQVADSFDAMTTNRPYQRSMSYDAAVKRLHDLSGSVFDPKMVELFTNCYEGGDLQLPEKSPSDEPPASVSQQTSLAPAPDSDDKSPEAAAAAAAAAPAGAGRGGA
jgi:HD-GYP domain-containing protein (c-di-GMP phosphodiesterase class II)